MSQRRSPSARDTLRTAGLMSLEDREDPAVRAECSRLARRVREKGLRTIGLAPAADDVAVPALALALGSALAETSAKTVGVADAHGSWSCARALSEAAEDDETPLAISWISENLAVLTPRSTAGGPAPEHLGIGATAVTEVQGFDELVFDLTGADHLGLQFAWFKALGGIAVVACSGRTTTRQVQRWLRDLPRECWLGVLLTGT